jgi:aldehyde dehydrogenase (NAD+)
MDFLKTLQIQGVNPGVSTGSAWIKTKAAVIESYSPVDGKLIGSVIAADEKS